METLLLSIALVVVVTLCAFMVVAHENAVEARYAYVGKRRRRFFSRAHVRDEGLDILG